MKNKTILSLARIQAYLLGLIGLILGLIYAIGGLIYDSFVTLQWISSSSSSGLSPGTLFAFGAIVGMPIAFALMGYIMGIVEAACHKILKAKFPSLRTPIDGLG